MTSFAWRTCYINIPSELGDHVTYGHIKLPVIAATIPGIYIYNKFVRFPHEAKSLTSFEGRPLHVKY